MKQCSTIKILLLLYLAGINAANAQMKKRVLFIGNSYTYVNNLPQIVADMANNTGDTLEYEMETPGGMTFENHYDNNPATLNKMKKGGWDYVVLQEQSQAPAYPLPGFQNWVYAYAQLLDSFFHLYNPCGKTIFYMTWGRKNGDAASCAAYSPSWPYYCTYHQMDSLIRERYIIMADSNKALLSPVGAVWRYIRVNNPALNLYDPDESHPSAAGSYASGCAFYTAIFKKDPSLLSYNFSLPAADAAIIRASAKKVVYDSMSFWHIKQYELNANFSYSINNKQVNFTNTSLNASGYLWDFGDGQTSAQPSPSYSYSHLGVYTVRLIATSGSCSDTMYQRVNLNGNGINYVGITRSFSIAPNVTNNHFTLSSTAFLSDVCTIEIVNSVGQVVLQLKSTGFEQQKIDIASLAAGNYLVTVYTNGLCIYRDKLIKL